MSATKKGQGQLCVLILAAGQGTRMVSDLPKVLHKLAGKPLLGHVIDCARELEPERICVVYGHGGEQEEPVLEGPLVPAVDDGVDGVAVHGRKVG